MASRMPKKTWSILITLVVTVLALVGIAPSCSFFSPSGSTSALHWTPASNETAPDFTLPTLTGANITLSELKGTPVVLHFWTTDCHTCRSELPYFEDVAQQSEGQIEVIAIDVGQNLSTVQKFFSYEPTMIVALDKNKKTLVSYCLEYNNPQRGAPFTIFIDSEGVAKYVQLGPFKNEAELWDALHSVF
jgi:thiol-disulfide isomerase/thioredoxin